MKLRILAAGLAVLASLPQAAVASQGKTPIHRATQVATPGSYIVTKDFSSNEAIVVEILADDVTIDLDGHTISSTSQSNTLIKSVGHTNIRVTNGKLTGGNVGVSFTTSGEQIFVQVDNLNVRGQAGPGSKGIHVSGESGPVYAVAVVRDNTVDAEMKTYICMQLDYLANSTVENNVLQNSWVPLPTGIGLGINGSTRLKVIRNVASGNRYGGIAAGCNGCDVSYNVASGNGGGTNAAAGVVVVGNDNTVSFNTCSRNTNGIQVQGSGNAIFDNTASENGPNGFELRDRDPHQRRERPGMRRERGAVQPLRLQREPGDRHHGGCEQRAQLLPGQQHAAGRRQRSQLPRRSVVRRRKPTPVIGW